MRAESDTAARLRKSQTEMTKTMSQLESLNRELQERSRAVDGEKAQLEKELLLLQSTLDSERRNYSQGSEEISELQGNPPANGNLNTDIHKNMSLVYDRSLPGQLVFSHFLQVIELVGMEVIS